jgi:hypothetical protein
VREEVGVQSEELHVPATSVQSQLVIVPRGTVQSAAPGQGSQLHPVIEVISEQPLPQPEPVPVQSEELHVPASVQSQLVIVPRGTVQSAAPGQGSQEQGGEIPPVRGQMQ